MLFCDARVLIAFAANGTNHTIHELLAPFHALQHNCVKLCDSFLLVGALQDFVLLLDDSALEVNWSMQVLDDCFRVFRFLEGFDSGLLNFIFIEA